MNKVKTKRVSVVVKDVERPKMFTGRKTIKIMKAKEKKPSTSSLRSVAGMCISASGSDSDFEALNETVVYNTGKTKVGSVANSKGGREDVAEIRSRLRKALFSCVSANKFKLHLKAQEEFENDLSKIMAIASELVDSV